MPLPGITSCSVCCLANSLTPDTLIALHVQAAKVALGPIKSISDANYAPPTPLFMGAGAAQQHQQQCPARVLPASLRGCQQQLSSNPSPSQCSAQPSMHPVVRVSFVALADRAMPVPHHCCLQTWLWLVLQPRRPRPPFKLAPLR